MSIMKAAVIREPGGPDVLKIETRPVPVPHLPVQAPVHTHRLSLGYM